jgi:hypothetical protein
MLFLHLQARDVSLPPFVPALRRPRIGLERHRLSRNKLSRIAPAAQVSM